MNMVLSKLIRTIEILDRTFPNELEIKYGDLGDLYAELKAKDSEAIYYCINEDLYNDKIAIEEEDVLKDAFKVVRARALIENKELEQFLTLKSEQISFYMEKMIYFMNTTKTLEELECAVFSDICWHIYQKKQSYVIKELVRENASNIILKVRKFYEK